MTSTPRSRRRAPASVYRRRRLAVAVAFVTVFALVGWGATRVASAVYSGDEAGSEPVSSPVRTLLDTAPRDCVVGDLAVSLARYKREWPQGEHPAFIATIRNDSASACQVDIDREGVLLVVSGADRVYHSGDCDGEREPHLVEIPAGASTEVDVEWNRQRSSPACPEELPETRPGTYRATWSVLGAQSEAQVFVLLAA